MNEWFAPRDGDNWRAALVDGLQTLASGQPPIENRLGVVDLAASGAGEVATEQRLQHQNQWIAIPARQLLFQKIKADLRFSKEWNHERLPSALASVPARGVRA